MNRTLRNDAETIIRTAIEAVKPDAAVRRAMEKLTFPGRVFLVAAGKAAWQMAKAAYDCLGDRIEGGVVVTKYHHVKGPIANFTCYEAGHPVPDENMFPSYLPSRRLPEQKLRGFSRKIKRSTCFLIRPVCINPKTSSVLI